ncbi:MAG: MATE family efflux transporter [Spirosomataceae bacterium]
MKKYLSLFLEALRGEEHNFTTGSINKAIFMLAVPSILEMSLESVFAVVDVSFVSRVGTDAVAVVGLTESVLTLVYSIAWGFSVAATAIISRRIGENNEAGASEAAGQVIVISMILAVLIGVPCFIFAEDILLAMGASASVIQDGLLFTKLMFASTPAIILLYTLSGALRGAGSAAFAMRSLVVANVVNILLDSVLVLGFLFFPKLGVVGAAVATSTGRTLGVLYQLRKLNDGSLPIRLTVQHLRPDWALIRKFLELAWGSTIQFIIASASWVFLTRILSSFGSEVVAGYTIAIRIIIFTILPSWGMANAAAALVGQNLGANQPERAEQSAWRAAYLNTAFLALVAVVFFVFAPNLVALFTDKPLAIETGIGCLRVICLGYVFFANGMVLVQAFNGAGDTRTPTLMNLVCFWAIEIPLAYFLARELDFGPTGVFASVAISESLMAIIAIILFRRGKWKLVQV